MNSNKRKSTKRKKTPPKRNIMKGGNKTLIQLGQNYYDGMYEPFLFTADDEQEFFNLKCEDLFTHAKITSERPFEPILILSLKLSTNKIVYFVGKFSQSRKENDEETEFGYFFNNYSNNFIRTYHDMSCPNIIFAPGDKDGMCANSKKVCSGYFIFMELAKGNLAQILSQSVVNDKQLTKYILDVLVSIELMTMNFVSHNDLKPENIYIVIRNKQLKAVVGDFGICKKVKSLKTHTKSIRQFLTLLRPYTETRPYLKEVIALALKYTNAMHNEYKKGAAIRDSHEMQIIISSDLYKVQKFFSAFLY